jgi:hypothetical protein
MATTCCMSQSLNGAWRLAADPRNEGRAGRWFDAARPEAVPTRVPGIIQEALPACHGVVWYWRSFDAPRHPRSDGRYLLRFAAVDYLADVWVNGKHLGGHEGGETPFVLDVTQAIRPGATNLLTVRVLNPSDDPVVDGIKLSLTPHRNKTDDQSYQPGSGPNYGGILATVDLELAPAVRIEGLHVKPDPRTGRVEVEVGIQNAGGTASQGTLELSIAPASGGHVLNAARVQGALSVGATVLKGQLQVEGPRLWGLDEPYLYRVTARLTATGGGAEAATDEDSVRCGFRDFRIVDGYFELNGKRIFLRSTHTGNHVPIGQVVPLDNDFLRRDLVYLKASGFNTARFISGMAYAEQLDLCDELGLMVYEECLAGWLLGESPQMRERFDRSVREMILRDRNHPSLTIWGLLNETKDGAVFRHAVEALALVRQLDETRLVLLSSGRWDGQPAIGSACNPGSRAWEHVWGIEAPGAPATAAQLTWMDDVAGIGGYLKDAGDAHVYPSTPHPAFAAQTIRNLGHGAKPVFLSEYGIGSLMNIVADYRQYEQVGARPDLFDATLLRQQLEKLTVDWQRFGMDDVYPFVEDMLLESQRLHSRQRLLGFDLIRSNPRICGYNLTGMLDHAYTGEGLWSFWRRWKPGTFDAVSNGWAPLRWCLFVGPQHGFLRRAFTVEAVLANEGVLQPGEYPVRFRLMGPAGVAWEKSTIVRVPSLEGNRGALAIPIVKEEVTLDGPAGAYQFAATMERGGAPDGGRLTCYLSDPDAAPRLQGTVSLWGVDERVTKWLAARGLRCVPLDQQSAAAPEVILVGDLSRMPTRLEQWQALARRIARGSTVLFLSPSAFQREKDSTAWLPLETKGRCYSFGDWLYHKECVTRRHRVFEGLQAPGVMDWDYYGMVVGHHLFDGQRTPDEVLAAAFAVGYCHPGGYAAGLLLGAYRLGAGRFYLNALRILENLERHPAADRLLANLIFEAQRGLPQGPAELPAEFEGFLGKVYPRSQ